MAWGHCINTMLLGLSIAGKSSGTGDDLRLRLARRVSAGLEGMLLLRITKNVSNTCFDSSFIRLICCILNWGWANEGNWARLLDRLPRRRTGSLGCSGRETFIR